MGRLKIYLMYHDESSFLKASAYAKKWAWMEPIRLPASNYMESAVFRLLEEKEPEWDREGIECVGLLKYNFEEKNPFYDFETLYETEKHHKDAWSFVNGHLDAHRWSNPTMLTYANICHPLFSVLWYLLFKPYLPTYFTLNDVFSEHLPAFYSNAWMAKTAYFKTTVSWIRKCMDDMDRREDLQELLFYDSKYPHNMPMTAIQRAMKLPYYTYHCFITERLPCFFLWKYGARLHQVGGHERATHPDPRIPLLRL